MIICAKCWKWLSENERLVSLHDIALHDIMGHCELRIFFIGIGMTLSLVPYRIMALINMKSEMERKEKKGHMLHVNIT